MVLQRSRLASLIAYSIYWVFHTNTRFNLRKTNAANEEPIGRLDNGRISLGISARPQFGQGDGVGPFLVVKGNRQMIVREALSRVFLDNFIWYRQGFCWLADILLKTGPSCNLCTAAPFNYFVNAVLPKNVSTHEFPINTQFLTNVSRFCPSLYS